MPDNDDGIILMHQHQHQQRSNSSARTQGPFDGAHGRLSTDVSTFPQTARRRRLSVDSWETRTITTSADGAISVFAIDVDGDGDVDVLSASRNDDTIAW